MPSLRKRVTSYFRQLSFHNEPRDPASSKRHININENSFVTKYLQGGIRLKDGPPILHGKNPTDLPNYELGEYEMGPESVVGCYSGPQGGLTTVKRQEKHLSVPDAEDIDFIDTANEENVELKKKSPTKTKGQPLDNTTMVIKVAGQEYCVTNRATKQLQHNKSHSLGSLSDFTGVIIETTKIDKDFNTSPPPPPSSSSVVVVTTPNSNQDEQAETNKEKKLAKSDKDKSSRYNLAKSKSEGNPFHHNQQSNRRRGRIRVVQRPPTRENIPVVSSTTTPPQDGLPPIDDSSLPEEWRKKSDLIYGISDSLYDRNQVTQKKNGDPIADCFGIISRGNSSILAVADGVNWGEKAAIAAKSAIHGSLHYLNKTIFNDTKPFDSLQVDHSTNSESLKSLNLNLNQTNRLGNTREVFVCLLRAFSCAHELILENKGMLTTLTVAVVLPLKRRSDDTVRYVCCVCNVGDTLAYVYSKRYGLRELTKGSHDVNCNRDMRDALGALGPVDGINPELSNLTLSLTTLNQGDLVMVASDGLTDNFDPNVCRFTVATTHPSSSTSSGTTSREVVPVPVRNHKLLRSKTTLDTSRSPRLKPRQLPQVVRNTEGLPYVTPLQRYELQLLLIEDILKNGITGCEDQCRTARKLCENLASFTFSITSAKRHTLEDHDLYFNNSNGVLVEVSQQEQKIRRKRGLEKVQNLPGKLDHVTVVAWNVANVS